MDEERKIVLTEETAPTVVDVRGARRQFSRVGWALAALMLLGSAAQLLMSKLLSVLAPELLRESWVLWVYTFAPLYLIGFPVCFLILHGGRRFEGEGERMSFGLFLRALCVSFFMMYAGNLIGNFINTFLQRFADVPAGNPVMSYVSSESAFFKILILVVLGPLMEELVFRRLLIDRLRGYGERLAVLVSALLFGLFHGNLSQFFYAFGLGLVFGYVYLRTRQLRWSFLLHMFINFIGGVVAPALLAGFSASGGPEAALLELSPAVLLYCLYAVCFLGLAITGLTVLVRNRKALRFAPAPEELPRDKRFSAAFGNTGMLLFLLACLALFVLNALQV